MIALCLKILGFHQDIQKEDKTGKEDQTESTNAQLDQIQDWQQNQVQRQEEKLEKNQAEVLSSIVVAWERSVHPAGWGIRQDLQRLILLTFLI